MKNINNSVKYQQSISKKNCVINKNGNKKFECGIKIYNEKVKFVLFIFEAIGLMFRQFA